MFESIIVDLLNRYLGDYVENLNASQLSLGVFSGAVNLENLVIKASALDDLDLPVRVLEGFISKLTLSIPWTSLYTSPTVVTIDGVYILAVPNSVVSYDEKKEESYAQDAKQKELTKIEMQLLAEKQQKDGVKKTAADDTFTEKLVANVIKNLEVQISNIHVRYEDRVSSRNRPFSIGISLKSLSLKTTDENWKETVIKETAVKTVFKMVVIDSLSVYFNTSGHMCTFPTRGHMQRPQFIEYMAQNIECRGGPKKITDYNFLVEPIKMDARLKLVQRPELDDYKHPKILLNLVLHSITTTFDKTQYRCMIEMIDLFGRLSLNYVYRKYRPPAGTAVKGNSAIWWKYAINAVRYIDVKPRLEQWSWTYIVSTRMNMKRYKDAYRRKLAAGAKPNKSDLAIIEECEKSLSVFCISLMRRKAEVEAANLPKTASSGWFGGWWGGGSAANAEADQATLGQQMFEKLSQEEKEQLYSSIGYSDKTDTTGPPKTYEEMIVFTKLDGFLFKLEDEVDKRMISIIQLKVSDIVAAIKQRPSANAIKAEVKMESLELFGMEQDGLVPQMVSSLQQRSMESPTNAPATSPMSAHQVSLLKFSFETNPIVSKPSHACDQRIRLEAQPLELIYDAKTMNRIASFFKPPKHIEMKQLSAAAMEKFREMRENSVTGLQHMIDTRSYTDIRVDLLPSYIIVPGSGFYRANEMLLIIDLGSLKVTSEKPQDISHINLSETPIEEILKCAFDKYSLWLDDFQVMFVDEKMAAAGVGGAARWKELRREKTSPIHILNPLKLNINLQKAIVDDSRLPKLRATGQLPLISLDISDKKLKNLILMLKSIPLPESEPPAAVAAPEYQEESRVIAASRSQEMKTLNTIIEQHEQQDSNLSNGINGHASDSVAEKAKSLDKINMTTLELRFILQQIVVTISQSSSTVSGLPGGGGRTPTSPTILDSGASETIPVAKFVIENIGAAVYQRTFDLSVDSFIGGFFVQFLKYRAVNDGPLVNLINTPNATDPNAHLLSIKYIQADKKSPEFHSSYRSTEKMLSTKIETLEVMFHQEAILTILQVLEVLKTDGDEPQPPASEPKDLSRAPSRQLSRASSMLSLLSDSTSAKPRGGRPRSARANKRSKVDEKPVIQLKLDFDIVSILMVICTEQYIVTSLRIAAINCSVEQDKDKTKIVGSLRTFQMFDPTHGAIYTKIVEARKEEDVFYFHVVSYNNNTSGPQFKVMSKSDLEIKAKMTQIKVIYLAKIVNKLQMFMDNFQTAKAAIMDAGNAAGTTAMDTAQNIASKAYRVKLDITIDGPVIIMPRHSRSTAAIAVHLGVLELHNHFSMVEETKAEIYPAVLDHLNITLKDMKLARVIMDRNEVRANVFLMPPQTLLLTIIRNLSQDWYKKVEGMKVETKLPKLTLEMSHGDYNLVMAVLGENMYEDLDQKTAAVPAPPSVQPTAATLDQESQKLKTTSRNSRTSYRGVGEALIEVDEEEAEVRAGLSQKFSTDSPALAMKIDVTIEKLSITIYSGDTALTSLESVHEMNKSLSLIELDHLELLGKSDQDGAQQYDVSLLNLTIDDVRKDTKRVYTRMIQKAEYIFIVTQQKAPRLVSATYAVDADGNCALSGELRDLYITANIEFLVALGDVFSKYQSPEYEVKQIKTKKKPPSAIEDSSTTSAAISSASAVASAETLKTVDFLMDFQITNPEVAVLEDATQQYTNCVLMTFGAHFKQQSTADATSLMLALRKFKIVFCVFDKDQRELTGGEKAILDSCELQMFGNWPTGSGQHIDVRLSHIVATLTPAIIRSITVITSQASPQPAVEEEVKDWTSVANDIWDPKRLVDSQFWYLNSEPSKAPVAPAKPATSSAAGDKSESGVTSGGGAPVIKEQMLLSIPVLLVKLEVGVGSRTVPMLVLEGEINGEIRNWATFMSLGMDLSMTMSYYNERLAVWEPLLEPIETRGGGLKHRPWDLNFQVQFNDTSGNTLPMVDEEGGVEEICLPPPAMSVSILSEDVMELTLTKTGLDVLQMLGEKFGAAYNLSEPPAIKSVRTPYLLLNETDTPITIKIDKTLEYTRKPTLTNITMKPGDKLELVFKAVDTTSPTGGGGGGSVSGGKGGLGQVATQNGSSSTNGLPLVSEKKAFTMFLDEFRATRELHVQRMEKRLYQISKLTSPGEQWSLICDVEAGDGTKVIRFHSLFQLRNSLPIAIEIYYRSERGEMILALTLEPDQVAYLPFAAIYTQSSLLFFKPRHDEFMISESGISWRGLEDGSNEIVSCSSATNLNQSQFFISIYSVHEKVFFENSDDLSTNWFRLNLCPTVVIHNLLPYYVHYLLENYAERVRLEAGRYDPLLYANISGMAVQVELIDYMGKDWMGKSDLTTLTKDEFTSWTFVSNDGTIKLELGVRSVANKGTIDLQLYCPYWMINKTQMPLQYKLSDDSGANFFTHPESMADSVVLFSFKAKSFTVKKKACLRVCESDWSDKFALDAAGSSGLVSCKFKNLTYEVGVSIRVSGSGLTKIITFTPYYMLFNHTKLTICAAEVTSGARWFDVAPDECVPFWPVTIQKQRMIMKIKIKDTDLETAPFCFNEPHTTMLKLEAPYGGLVLDCQTMENAIIINLQEFAEERVAVRLVNDTASAPIYFQQLGGEEINTLQAQMSVLWSWEDPLGKKELCWGWDKSSMENNKKAAKKTSKTFLSNQLNMDGIGDAFIDADTKIYWVSFLDGLQRVLLFTDDISVVTNIHEVGDLDQIDQERNVFIHGLGLSLVDNFNRQEVAYIGITSSGVIWEERKGKRWKAFKVKQSELMEEAYVKYQNQLAMDAEKAVPLIHLEKMEIDFEKMVMKKPNKRLIRRSFQPGIWFHQKVSARQMFLHAKINRVQIDSQLPAAVFPTVLSPVPLPKSVAADSVPKSFIETSLMMSKKTEKDAMQIKYAKTLVQEITLKVDMEFLNAITCLFTKEEAKKDYDAMVVLFEADQKLVVCRLQETDAGQSFTASDVRNHYDLCHISPLKIHLSFSLETHSGEKKEIQSKFIHVFLQSVGIVLSDVQDVVFKLGYFERKHQVYTQKQLQYELTRHYIEQALKQLYVLVLGLDVLGNPFGVLRGFATGIEDLFYEPYQGAIQGPEEFAEGVALGVRSLVGHTIGGAAGAVSRIGGALGKGLATLTFDDDYQKKRREQMSKRPDNMREGIARGGKGLVMGVFEGVTGVVTKPIEGAKQGGVGGFVKGVGKGLVGVVARPATGVVDFASSGFEGIRRVAEIVDEVGRLRPARYLQADGVVRAYCRLEASGNSILQELEKGKYAKTDIYYSHCPVSKDGKYALLVTNKRIFFVTKGEILGHWDVDWQFQWSEIKELPQLTEKGVQILLKHEQTSRLKLFGKSSVGKLIPIADTGIAKFIVQKMQEAMTAFR